MKTHFGILVLCCGLVGQAVAADLSKADRKFAQKAAVGGMAEVRLGEIAQKNAASPDVKKFGAMMVADHGRAGDELKTIAGQQNITLPTELPARMQAKADALAALQGAAFDHAYVQAMVKDHQKDLAEFQTEAKSGSDPALKQFAEKNAAMIESHLQAIQKIQEGLK